MEEGFVYKRKPLDPNQEFVVVRVPDKLALGQLITEIRGERTMAQLAEQCNVSPSTLSRAVNGKMTKPLSQELIKALAAKSDDPFMLERLVRANGMADAKTCEERKQMAHDNLSLREERLNTERKVKNIISTELLRRGKKIQYMERLEINGERRSQYGLRWLSSFALVIEDPKPYIWNFADNGEPFWTFSDRCMGGGFICNCKKQYCFYRSSTVYDERRSVYRSGNE